MPFFPPSDIDENDESGQSRVAALWGMVYAMGSCAGPLLADFMMELKVPFLCRSSDWPVVPNVTLAAYVEATTTTSANDTTSAPQKQHCFDGTFTILFLLGVCMFMFYGTFLCRRALMRRWRRLAAERAGS